MTQIQAGIMYGENLGIVDPGKRNILGLTQFLSSPSFRNILPSLQWNLSFWGLILGYPLLLIA